MPLSRYLPALLALGLMLLLGPAPAEGARWHPGLRWHTLDTEHFSIHFHQGGDQLAEEFGLLAEEVHDVLAPLMKWHPRGRTQVTLIDSTDSANGFARTTPGNQIVLYVVQPTPDTSLDGYEDWWFAIFVHEYAHIVQIDMVEDVLQLVRWVAGRLIVPGGVLPAWMTEGFATYIETVTTTGGRGRSTYTDMLLRTAALEGTFPRIDMAEGFGSEFPRGQLRYLYGVRFHLELAEKTRPEAWIDFHHYHARGIIPFLLPAKKAFGERFVPLWKQWREDQGAEALRTVERLGAEGAGITATRIVPTRVGQALRPRYTADGSQILYNHRSPSERSALRAIGRNGIGDRRIYRGGVEGMVRIEGQDAVLAALVGVTGRYTSFKDLFRISLVDGKSRRLTAGRRLTWPAPHPSGTWAVAVQTRMGQTQLVRVDLVRPTGPDDGDSTAAPSGDAGLEGSPLATGGSVADGPGGSGPEEARRVRLGAQVRIDPLTAADDGSQFAGPVWDPAGERIAVSIWKPGGFRDIHVLGPDGALLRTLTWDRATDSDPAWSPDGEYIVWSSDRDGILNLYAHRWSDAATFRVTRLVGGARYPDVAPDGTHLVFQGFGAEGWRVEEMPFDPDSWEPVRLSARVLPGPKGGPSAQALAPLHPLEGVPGPAAPWGTGPRLSIARDQARDDFRTLAPAAASTDAAAPEPTKRENRRARYVAYSGVENPGERETPDIPDELGTVRVYNPLRTLFPPRYLTVFGSLTDTGAVGGVGTGGYDALEQHVWAASLQYRTDSRFLGGAASYTLNAFHPRFSVAYSAISIDYGRLWLRNKEDTGGISSSFSGSYRAGERYYERRDVLSAGVLVPVGRRQRISARYKAEFRRPLRDLPDDADPTLVPTRGSFSGIVLGWSTGQIRRFPRSVSPEDDSRLLSVSVDIESSFLGAYRLEPDGTRSELHRAVATIEGRTYQTMPWLRNHVLAVRGVIGATLGTPIAQRTFRIGGPFGDSPFVSLPDRYYALRGYPTSSMRGDHLWLATAEYRFPLLRIERGFATAPIWLRGVSARVFAEAGQVFSTSDYAGYGGSPDGFVQFLANTKPSVGVELEGDIVLFWGGLFTGRVGYSFGFADGAYPSGIVYAQLGTSF
ncbi:MAG: PD40 domain-containing protein [Deltaproteobacteria bacterium]|nr:PD40 domain-containing protein [Deltaproteobacteria bacterium]